MTGSFITEEFIAAGVVLSGMDLLVAFFTLAYVGRLLFDGVFSLSLQFGHGCSEVVKQSLQGQHIMRRAR